MNIVIPMAGSGKRFIDAGFVKPKPLIDINGKTMIQRAISTLGLDGQFVFIIRKYEDDNFNQELRNVLSETVNDFKIIELSDITEGAACTCLMAKKYIDNDDELVIANCDQIMEWNTSEFLKFVKDDSLDGGVVTYEAQTTKNSYIRLDENGFGIELAEKKVISNHSLNGIHCWKRGSDFVKSANLMIQNNVRTNNEFYIAPTYNELIKQGKKIGIYEISKDQHYAVGTPIDLRRYMCRNERS